MSATETDASSEIFPLVLQLTNSDQVYFAVVLLINFYVHSGRLLYLTLAKRGNHFRI